MEFAFPSDFKQNTIDKMLDITSKYSDKVVGEVYGNILSEEMIGNGRGYLENTCDSFDRFVEYVQYLNSKNIKFNYTLNASCLSNFDIENKSRLKIIKYIDKLISIGVRSFTISSLPLVQLLKYIYGTDVSITLSTIANINSVHRAIEAERLGVSVLVIGEDETRNIPLLKEIRQAVKCKLEIIVNSMCIWNCIYRQSHYNALAHMTAQNQDALAYFPNQCYKEKKRNPVEYIKMPWIRPEDLKYYVGMGIDIFKIIGRELLDKAKWDKMLEVYCKEKYSGNLLDLNYGFVKKIETYIDNKALNGFGSYFFEKRTFDCYNCGNTLNKCIHCKYYFEKSYMIKTDN